MHHDLEKPHLSDHVFSLNLVERFNRMVSSDETGHKLKKAFTDLRVATDGSFPGIIFSDVIAGASGKHISFGSFHNLFQALSKITLVIDHKNWTIAIENQEYADLCKRIEDHNGLRSNRGALYFFRELTRRLNILNRDKFVGPALEKLMNIRVPINVNELSDNCTVAVIDSEENQENCELGVLGILQGLRTYEESRCMRISAGYICGALDSFTLQICDHHEEHALLIGDFQRPVGPGEELR